MRLRFTLAALLPAILCSVLTNESGLENLTAKKRKKPTAESRKGTQLEPLEWSSRKRCSSALE
jgi:hypothetical protein